MERVVAFYARDFPEHEREYVAAMRLLAEHPAGAKVAAGLEAVPFNRFGFGLFPPGRVGDPESPCLSPWYDDPHPLYWVQVRRRWDRDILICDQPASPEEAWAAAAERRLVGRSRRAANEAEAHRSPGRSPSDCVGSKDSPEQHPFALPSICDRLSATAVMLLPGTVRTG